MCGFWVDSLWRFVWSSLVWGLSFGGIALGDGDGCEEQDGEAEQEPVEVGGNERIGEDGEMT